MLLVSKREKKCITLPRHPERPSRRLRPNIHLIGHLSPRVRLSPPVLFFAFVVAFLIVSFLLTRDRARVLEETGGPMSVRGTTKKKKHAVIFLLGYDTCILGSE